MSNNTNNKSGQSNQAGQVNNKILEISSFLIKENMTPDQDSCFY